AMRQRRSRLQRTEPARREQRQLPQTSSMESRTPLGKAGSVGRNRRCRWSPAGFPRGLVSTPAPVTPERPESVDRVPAIAWQEPLFAGGDGMADDITPKAYFEVRCFGELRVAVGD